VEELPLEVRTVFTFPDDLFTGEPKAEWLEREGMYKDYTLRRGVWGRVNRFYDNLYQRREEEIIVVAHEQLLKDYLLPSLWDQLIPNACGYSFVVKWEVKTPNVQKKKTKEIELVMHMEEIKPRPIKVSKKTRVRCPT